MRALVGLLMAAPLMAQFTNLATGDTGDRVWFSSALTLRGTDENALPKIFVADGLGNVQLVAQAAADDPYSLLTNPEVSADGTVLAYAAQYNCPPEIVCKVLDTTHGVITMPSGSLTMPGTFHLSRNGRWAVREGYAYFGLTGQFEILDLTTRQTRDVPVQNWQPITGGGRQVASNGAVLVYADVLWMVQADGTAQEMNASFAIPSASPFFSTSANVAIDDLGTDIVYQVTTSGCAIVWTSAGTDAPSVTLVQDQQSCTMQGLSADGRTVLFISPGNFDGSNAAGLPQCWVVDAVSKSIRAVGHDAAGIAEAALSGNGNMVWATTYAGRLIRMDRGTGVTREIIGRTTAVDQSPLGFALVAAPGALMHLTGRGLAAEAAVSGLPLATTLGGVQVLADGQPLPLVSVSPADILFQVPWDMQGTHTLTVTQAQSAFAGPASRALQIQPAAPQFLYTADGSPAIMHEDFHGVVSLSDPAHPDEILHLYMTGLGAVTPAVPTGEAAPAAPLSMVAGPLYVNWQGEVVWNLPSQANVLFAGLAPGLVGVDQIDVQVPHVAPAQLDVSVQAGSEGGTGATFEVGP